MAKEIGQKAAQKQFEIMEEQQKKAQEFIDQKVTSQFLNSFWLLTFPPSTFLQIKSSQVKFAYNSTHLSQLLLTQITIQINTDKSPNKIN